MKDAQVCTCRTTGKRHVIQNVLVEVILHECAIEEYCKTIAFTLPTHGVGAVYSHGTILYDLGHNSKFYIWSD